MWKSNLPFIINYENIVSIMWLKVDYDIKREREREGVGGGGGGGSEVYYYYGKNE